MPRVRIALCIALLGALMLVSTAHAAVYFRDVPGGLDQTVAGEHFVVHFGADVSASQAQRGLGDLEHAYATFVGLGFPSPLPDADGLIDVYVFDTGAGEGGTTRPDTTDPQTGAWVSVGPSSVADDFVYFHEVFHVFQFTLDNLARSPLAEATANWGAQQMFVPPPNSAREGPNLNASLDCDLPAPCGELKYERWPFYEYLSERFGPGVIRELFEADRALGTNAPLGAVLDATLSAHGSDASDAYLGFVRAYLTGDFTRENLRGAPARSQFVVTTGRRSGPVAVPPVTADHLGATYLLFAPPESERGCRAAKLTVRVGLPDGVPTQPVLAKGSAKAVALPITGNVATTTIPWKTCSTKSADLARMALPNGSTTVDAASFTVTASLKVPPKRKRRHH